MCHLCEAKCSFVLSQHINEVGLLIHENEDHSTCTVATLVMEDDGIHVQDVLDPEFAAVAAKEAEVMDARFQAAREKILVKMPPALRALMGG